MARMSNPIIAVEEKKEVTQKSTSSDATPVYSCCLVIATGTINIYIQK